MRADFYIDGADGKLHWLGSLTEDGSPDMVRPPRGQCLAEEYGEFLDRACFGREEWVVPEHGLPTAASAEYAYVWAPMGVGRVLVAYKGRGWVTADQVLDAVHPSALFDGLPKRPFPPLLGPTVLRPSERCALVR
jgi:hypothetical protein